MPALRLQIAQVSEENAALLKLAAKFFSRDRGGEDLKALQARGLS